MGRAVIPAWMRERPVAVTIALIELLGGLATGTAAARPAAESLLLFGTSPDAVLRDHRFWTILTSALLPVGPAGLVLLIAAVLLVVGGVEQRAGSRRTATAFAVSAVAGTLGGVLVQSAGLVAHRFTPVPPDDLGVIDPLTPVVGVLLAGSAFVGPLWRRRIRLVGTTALLVALLYSGGPADVYRLIGGLAGLATGVALAHRRPVARIPRSSHHEARTLLAAVALTTAVGPVLAVLSPHGYGLLHPLGLFLRPLRAVRAGDACRHAHLAVARCAREVLAVRLDGPGALALSVLPLAVLAVAAFGMWHGRRTAAIAAVLVDVLYAVLATIYFAALPLLGDSDQLRVEAGSTAGAVQAVLAIGVPLTSAALILANLDHFDVREPPRVARRLAAGAAAVVAGCGVLYVGGGLAVRGQFMPVVGLGDLLSDLPERFVPVEFLRLRRLDFVPVGPVARLLWSGIGPVAWTALLAALLLSVVAVQGGARGAEAVRVRELLRTGTVGPLGWMATWAGSSYWFSADGAHAVAYREVNGIAIAVGEPIGVPAGADLAAEAFALHCDDRGLVPVFYGVRPGFVAGLPVARPWLTVVIGEDTVLHPGSFSMRGKRWADVRSSINRADRAGVRAVWTDWAALSLRRRSQIDAISEEWLADRQLPELGFTLGGLEEMRDPEVRLMLAIGAGDSVEAATSWLPTYRDGEVVGYTLDFMRRRPESMNGVMEFLIASAALAAQERGLEFLSLSAAPLVTSSDAGAGPLDRFLGWLGRSLEPVYGFRSLAAFKDKFQPTLQPLVLAYPEAAVLPAVGIALTRAYLPRLSVREVVRMMNALR